MVLSESAQTGKAWLQETDANGVSVYGHLTGVLAQLLESRPGDALGALESVSAQVKKGHFTAASAEAPPAPTALPDSDGCDAWREGNNALLKVRACARLA
jgi:hypothetical protein